MARKTASSDTNPQNDAPTALYQVLTPFKFRGHVVKPPTFLELTAEQAKPYQDAKVLGTEAGEVPTVDGGET